MTDNRNAIQEYNFLDIEIKEKDEYLYTLLNLMAYYERDIDTGRSGDIELHKRAIKHLRDESLELRKKINHLTKLRDVRKKAIMANIENE